MPPNSTQNLNAKLSPSTTGDPHHHEPARSFSAPPIQSSAPPVRIVSGTARYRGGYHLNV
jgi:hypothetical protein